MTDDRSEQAIACSLHPGELHDRRAAWERLAERALLGSRPTKDGVHLRYSASEDTERELRELVRLEGECCPFAEWQVSRRCEELVVDVTSAGDGAATVHAIFGVRV